MSVWGRFEAGRELPCEPELELARMGRRIQ
jgi:hypothetical protein